MNWTYLAYTFFENPHYIYFLHIYKKSFELWKFTDFVGETFITKMEVETTMVLIFKNALQMIKFFYQQVYPTKTRTTTYHSAPSKFIFFRFICHLVLNLPCRAHPIITILVKILHCTLTYNHLLNTNYTLPSFKYLKSFVHIIRLFI